MSVDICKCVIFQVPQLISEQIRLLSVSYKDEQHSQITSIYLHNFSHKVSYTWCLWSRMWVYIFTFFLFSSKISFFETYIFHLDRVESCLPLNYKSLQKITISEVEIYQVSLDTDFIHLFVSSDLLMLLKWNLFSLWHLEYADGLIVLDRIINCIWWWTGVLVPVRVPSMGQIFLFKNHSYSIGIFDAI